MRRPRTGSLARLARDPTRHHDDAPSPPHPLTLEATEGEGSHADASADDGNLRVSIEPLYPGRPQRRLPISMGRRALLNVLSLAALVLLLVAFLSIRGLGASAKRALVSTPSTRSSPAPALPHGWTLAGPSEAQTIVFAPSDPTTAYTCGAAPLGGHNQLLDVTVGVSHDYGRTWSELPSPLLSPWCDITVNPTDPHDVALLTVVCASCGATPTLNLYRTTDGGDDWSLWLLPPRGAIATTDFTGYLWAWAGGTLFIAPVVVGEQRSDLLAASIAQRPFVWVGQSALFARAPPDTGIISLIGSRHSLFVTTFSFSSDSPAAGARTMRTDDDGVAWQPFAPTVLGGQVEVDSAGAPSAGAALFGYVEPAHGTPPTLAPYAWSTDGGATWHMLPAFPGPTGLAAQSLTAAPDGTVYASVWNCCGPSDPLTPDGIYRIAPGAAGWTYLGPLPGGDLGSPLVLSWNAAGHPLALWARAYKSRSQYNVVPGIERHQR